MIKLIKKGKYRFVETGDKRKLLYLGKQGYTCTYTRGVGEVLTPTKYHRKLSDPTAEGNYKVYDVKNDPNYVDLPHLELALDHRANRSYLLLDDRSKHRMKSRIVLIPTDEIINQTQ